MRIKKNSNYGLSVLLAYLLFINISVASAQVNNNETESNDKWVDLGLSVRWGTCNIGADSPEQPGRYFSFGETEDKQSYSWDNYKWCNGSETSLTRYNADPNYGKVDYQYIIKQDDDVAYTTLGGSWRIPTEVEWKELMDNCIWTLVTDENGYGYKVTSKKDGYTDRSIYFPAAGLCNGSSLYTSSGFYWSSTTGYYGSNEGAAKAFFLNFSKKSQSLALSGYMNGMTIRPVYGDKSAGTFGVMIVGDNKNNNQEYADWVDINDYDVIEPEDGPIFMVVETMPEFPGGSAALQDFLRNNVKYPAICRENNIQGRVIVSFVVDQSGYITDIEVEKSVHPQLDAAAIRVVAIMPRWKPGMQKGKGVKTKFSIPVSFRLN